MDLILVLLRRAAATSLACVACALLLLVWRAQSDVADEVDAAAQLAQLSELLASLHDAPADRVDAQIGRLRELGRADRLRHLRFRLEDAASAEVLAESGVAERSPAAMAPVARLLLRTDEDRGSTWRIARADGRSFRVSLSAHPFSEQREAADEILAVTGVLLFYALSLLVAVYWAVRSSFAPLRLILDAIARFERQDYAVRLPALRLRELDVIARALNHLAATLHQTREERRELSAKLLTLQEDERAHLSRELHDALGQSLTAMRADLSYLQRCVEQPEARSVIEGLAQHCADVQQGVRELLRSLAAAGVASPVGPVPLHQLLESLVQYWRQRPGQATEYALSVDIESQRIPQGLALNLYRMTQEALTNVARHAGAHVVTIRLASLPGDEAVLWSVCDDGVGIASFADAVQQGNGLAAIRERVWAHGGSLEVHACPGTAATRGLFLSARFPLARPPGMDTQPAGGELIKEPFA